MDSEEGETMSEDYKVEEKYQAIEKFADRVVSELEDKFLEVDGLPHAGSEAEAEAMSDIRACVKDKEALKTALMSGFIETMARFVEIDAQ